MPDAIVERGILQDLNSGQVLIVFGLAYQNIARTIPARQCIGV
jgi:hypothetical protein